MSGTSDPRVYDKRLRHVAMSWVFIGAFVVRLAFVLAVGAKPAFPDENRYLDVAGNILTSREIRSGEMIAFTPPVYPVFLAGCLAIAPKDPVALVRVCQAVMGAASCVGVFLLACYLFRGRIAAAAGAMAALYPIHIFFTKLLLTETSFILLLVLLIYLLLRLDEQRSYRIAAAIGAVSAMTILLRPSSIYLPVAFCIGALIWWRRRAETVRLAVVSGLVGALVMAPWVVRNWIRFDGAFVPTTTMAGHSLYEGNSELATGGPAGEIVAWPPGIDQMEELERDRELQRRAWDYIRAHPGRTARMAVEKLSRFWRPVMNYHAYRSIFYDLVTLLSFGPVMILAAVGLWVHRDRFDRLWILLVPAAYYSAVHSIFIGSVRYRTPAMAPIFVLSAAGLFWIWERVRRPAHERSV